jgi:hypothetical protein
MYAGRSAAFGALLSRAADRPMTAFLSRAEIQTEALLDHATNLALRQSVV